MEGPAPASEPVRGDLDPERVERTIRALVEARGPDRTICPSEAARALVGDDDFRRVMPEVREAAARLAARGELAVTQRGRPVDAREARGPIRLGPARSSPAPPPKRAG